MELTVADGSPLAVTTYTCSGQVTAEGSNLWAQPVCWMESDGCGWLERGPVVPLALRSVDGLYGQLVTCCLS